VRPGKRETPTANIAITSRGLNGGREALGTARSTMLAYITLATFRENAASTHGAKYCLGPIYEMILGPVPPLRGQRSLSIAIKRSPCCGAKFVESDLMMTTKINMHPSCPSCAKRMARSTLGRRIFECLPCHEIVQFLVIEVSDAMPWSENYSVDCLDCNSDDPISEK
jgi:hypothetical protein